MSRTELLETVTRIMKYKFNKFLAFSPKLKELLKEIKNMTL